VKFSDSAVARGIEQNCGVLRQLKHRVIAGAVRAKTITIGRCGHVVCNHATKIVSYSNSISENKKVMLTHGNYRAMQDT